PDLDCVAPLDRREALQPLNLVLLEQELDALSQSLDRFLPAVVHRVEVELDFARLHAPLGERPVMRFLEQLRCMEQRLGWDAADVEAGSSQGLAALCARG